MRCSSVVVVLVPPGLANEVHQKQGFGVKTYLEDQRDLVSRGIMARTEAMIQPMGFLSLLTKSPWGLGSTAHG